MAPRGNVTVDLAGEIFCGEPLRPIPEQISIPRRVIEKDELVYRIGFAFDVIKPGRYAIAELRNHAVTAELVLAVVAGKIYLGRWWAKHGAKDLVVGPSLQPMRDVEIVAVINLVFEP